MAEATPLWKNPKVIAAAVLVVALIVVGVLAVGKGGDSEAADQSAAVGAPHGPTSVTAGVPTGYTHDMDGAASAAVNYMQLVGNAQTGRVDVAKVRELATVSNPEPNLGKVLETASDRRQSQANTGTTVPVSVAVSSNSADEAVVTVWATSVGVFRKALPDGKPDPNAKNAQMASLWSTTRIAVRWDEGKRTWLAKDWGYKQGPEPKDVTDIPLDDPIIAGLRTGQYTLFVN
ncbi:hypothetical protein AXK57_21905 [Tsukamurella pulmonis]|uniref:hypothetical protein n=1 Tax=Tsukamurella pulmonis TaxID=47312 RepID=UPI0007990B57|nr:hypothetical protein [Tsukamurella pulmonis]KXP11598.1 hypothetical protein AXK57_21905 [Tsukamurella pulmonis]